jgi:hypothetical protein
LEDVLSIDQGYDRIEAGVLLKLGDVQKSLRHRTGVGNPGGLDQDIIQIGSFEQFLNAFNQVFSDGATDATIAHLDHIFGLGLN